MQDAAKQKVLIQYLTDAIQFVQQMENVIPVACELLGSKSPSDVTEAIELFVTAAEFALDGAIKGVRKMLALVWSKDNGPKEALIAAYKRLYLSPDPAVYQNKKVCDCIYEYLGVHSCAYVVMCVPKVFFKKALLKVLFALAQQRPFSFHFPRLKQRLW